MKKLTISKLKKKVWAIFSKCIRLEGSVNGYNTCVTCGDMHEIEDLDAGHFIHGNTKKTYFDERNVWPQCTGCNRYRSGNLIKYTLFLEKTFGSGIIQELEKASNQGVFKRGELELLYIYYEEKLKSLEDTYG